MPIPFLPATDIYEDSDYAQQIANRYQGNQYYVPGFGSGDEPGDFARNYGRGYYRYEDTRSAPTALLATGLSLATGRTALPMNRRTLANHLDVYENSRAYSLARGLQLRQMAYERADRMARNVALQRNQFYGLEQRERIRNVFDHPAAPITLAMLQAAIPPHTFEAMFGRAGSGMGMFDAAYSQATYRLHDDGSRWSPEERIRYANQAVGMMYADPEERAKRRLNSVEGGQLWSGLEALGLLGGNEADPFRQDAAVTVKDAITYFRDNDVTPYAGERTKAVHEKVQRVQAVNDRRTELARLRAMIREPLDADQKIRAIHEFQVKSSELAELEKATGVTSHTRGIVPKDPAQTVEKYAQAEAAMLDLQKHYRTRSAWGRDQEGYDKKKEELALAAHTAFRDAELGMESGRRLDLNHIRSDQDMQLVTNSLERARRAQERYRDADLKANAGVTEQEVNQNANRYFQAAGERFAKIVSDPVRDPRTGNSQQWEDLQTNVRKLMETESRGGSDEEIAQAKRRALETAGGGAEGELVIRRTRQSLFGRSRDLDVNDPETRELLKQVIRSDRNTERDDAKLAVDQELLRGGLRSAASDQYDLKQLPLDEIVSLSDAIIAAEDDPRLTAWLKNAAMLNSKKGRWAEYENAIKALQESITDRNASPAKLLETLNNFAGGNLHQQDTTQLKRTVQQTYALARQLGQGDEYVEATVGQSQQMLAMMQVNRAFAGWHGVQAMADQAAALENPNYHGVWGTETMAETSVNRSKRKAAWLASRSANQYGAAWNVREIYGDFRDGSNAANYMEALAQGRTTFEETYLDREGKEQTRKASVQMSEGQFRKMIVDSINSTDPERLKGAQSALGSILMNQEMNQHALFKHQEDLAGIQHAQQSAAFVSRLAGTTRFATSRGLAGQQAGAELQQLGIDPVTTGRIMQNVNLGMAERMLDSEEVGRVAGKFHISVDDTAYMGKVGVAMQQEELERIAMSEPQGSAASRVAGAYLKRMADPVNLSEMAAVTQTRMDQVAQLTGYGNMAQAAQELDRKLETRSQVQIASAKSEQREKDAYREGISPTLLAGISDSIGSGATPMEVMNAALEMYDLKEDNPLMIAHRDFQIANQRVTKLENERYDLMRNTSIPNEERKRMLAENTRRMESAVQNLGDAQATLQPLLTEMRLQVDNMSSAAFDAQFGQDLDLLDQAVTVDDDETGGFRLRKLKRNEVRINNDRILQVWNGQEWEDKKDAVYFGQFSMTDDHGEEQTYFRELTRTRDGQWQYRGDDGRLVDFDPESDKMSVGTRIFTKNKRGETLATDLQWTQGVLTKTSSDGRVTSAVRDTAGNYIRMDSEIGQALYAAAKQGELDPNMVRLIEANQADRMSLISAASLDEGRKARHRALMEANQASTFEKQIVEEANKYVDSTGAVVRIDPRKIRMQGTSGEEETFYMLYGYDGPGRRQAELAHYQEEKEGQKRSLTEYFEADDRDAKKYVRYESDAGLKTARAIRRKSREEERRLTEGIAFNESRLGNVTGDDKTRLEADLKADQEELDKIRALTGSLIERSAVKQAQLARVGVQAGEVRDIEEAEVSVALDDAILQVVHEQTGDEWADRDMFKATDLQKMIGQLKKKSGGRDGRIEKVIRELELNKRDAQIRAGQAVKTRFMTGGGMDGLTLADTPTADANPQNPDGSPVLITPILKEEFNLKQVKPGAGVRQMAADVPTRVVSLETGREIDAPVPAAARSGPPPTVEYDLGGEPIVTKLRKTARIGGMESGESESQLALGATGLPAGATYNSLKEPDLYAAAPPVFTGNDGDAIPSGTDGEHNVGNCTLHAGTVHFKVNSMDLKNGSVIIETVGTNPHFDSPPSTTA
jgi:hypothetical protein